MIRERELLKKAVGVFRWLAKNELRVHKQATIITEIDAILAQPEAEPDAWFRYEGDYKNRFTKGWIQFSRPEKNGIPLYDKYQEPQSEAEPARKIGGGYQADGWVISKFKTRAGKYRVVFEFKDIPGMLHIFSLDQIEPAPQQEYPKQTRDETSAPAVCPECGSASKFLVFNCINQWHRRPLTQDPAPTAGETPDNIPEKTIAYWIEVYCNPASGDHFRGHAVLTNIAKQLLRQRNELRAENERLRKELESKK